MTRIIDTQKARRKTPVSISNKNTQMETAENRTMVDEAIDWLSTLPLTCKDGAKAKLVTDMAIEALQREIPKNPIVNYVADSDGARRLNDGWTEDSYLCPVCHTYFGEVFEEGYCRKCGQKLIQKRVMVIQNESIRSIWTHKRIL